MIYLRDLARTALPGEPATVALIADTDDWIEPQVSAELDELFPSARRVAVRDAELIVVAAAARSLPRLAAKAGSGRRGRAVWLYAVDEGRVDVLADARHIRRWRTRRASGARLQAWVRAHPARWRLLANLRRVAIRRPR